MSIRARTPGAFALAALSTALSALLAPGARASGTCTIYFTGATNSGWGTASNWSLTDGGPSAGRTPKNTDYVCMSTAPTRSAVTLAASAAVAGINFPDTGTVHPSRWARVKRVVLPLK